jgi:hypothetical protein
VAFEVFISYSHRDIKLREELTKHLSNLRNQGIISNWHDGDIAPGTEWKSQILDHLNTARIILLLISADFMASDFCYSIEMKQAIARHDAKEACVLPIILRPSDWEGSPFEKLQVLPTYGKPVSKWTSHDDAWKNVVEGIKRAIKDLTTNP